MGSFDRRRAIRASLYAVSGQALLAAGKPNASDDAPSGPETPSARGWVSVYDTRFAGGARGDGETDDTKAIALAANIAATEGRSLFMAGTFAVANLKLSGAGGALHVIGDPVLIQARPNTPCIAIEDEPLQQLTGCRLTCTVVPHPESSKDNPNNVALNLTGFSSSDIVVMLGQAPRHTAKTGRFNTVVYADSALPFHYGNRIRLIASAVPAPKYGVNYSNRKKGVHANPNVNMISGWFYSLDTVHGDVLISVGDTTQTIVEGPTLIEQCPNAIGVLAGNFTTIRDAWFEQVGVAAAFGHTSDTVANDCRVERCNFSGDGHVVLVSNKLETLPSFHQCLGDFSITSEDRIKPNASRLPRVRSYRQPPAPSLRLLHGSGRISPDQASLRRCVDLHGRTTYQLRYIIKPETTGRAIVQLVPIDGWEIEQAVLGIRDAAGQLVSWGLSDDLSGSSYEWVWANTSPHVVNIRATLFCEF